MLKFRRSADPSKTLVPQTFVHISTGEVMSIRGIKRVPQAAQPDNAFTALAGLGVGVDIARQPLRATTQFSTALSAMSAARHDSAEALE